VAFLAVIVGVVLIDPLVSSRIPPQPYPMRLVWYVANLAVPLGITFALLRYTDIRRRRAEARSEELLTNAIPVAIAARLKRGERRIAESYPETTILFADLAGFTPWAGQTGPAHVVGFLDELFTRFDELAAECGVEKIKTIGDAYLAAAGLSRSAPESDSGSTASHIHAAADLALTMLSVVEAAGPPWRIRIGIHNGPVVAGVIGTNKFVYDLWGDAVNVASRLEASSEPGRVQVSASIAAATTGAFIVEPRGQVNLKGKGSTETFFLVGRTPTG
jgi:class 3 adenylate cyclase